MVSRCKQKKGKISYGKVKYDLLNRPKKGWKMKKAKQGKVV